MNITALLQFHGENSEERSNNISLEAADALAYILEHHLQELMPSSVLILMCLEHFFCDFFNDFLDKLLPSCKHPAMQIVNLSANITQNISKSMILNIILTDSYESFRSIDSKLNLEYHDHNEFYYVFLQNYDERLPEEMNKIFDHCWENHMINCNVQIQNAKGEILVYTYYPFTSESCGRVTIRQINQYKDGELVNKGVFPKKLLNFHQCRLRVAMWDTPPFVFLTDLGNGSGLITGGIEGRLVQELARKLNFKIEVKVPPNNEKRGKLTRTNMTGAIRMLNDQLVDFSIGYFYRSTNQSAIVTTSISYYQTTFMFCFPKAPYKLTSLGILFFPFMTSTWLLLSAVVALIFILLWLMKKKIGPYHRLSLNRELVQEYQNVFLMTLGMPCVKMPGNFVGRVLSVSWIIFTLIIRTGYQARLYELMRTHPVKKLPETLIDFIAGNFTVVLRENAYLDLMDIPLLSKVNLHLIEEESMTRAFEIIEEQDQMGIAAASSPELLSFYENQFHKHNYFHKLRENIVALQVTLYLSKHSYLVEQLNEFLLIFCSAGLINFWMNQEANYSYMNKRVPPEVNLFTLNDVYMIFVIMIIGHVLAGIIFLLEVFWEKILFLKKNFNSLYGWTTSKCRLRNSEART